MTTVHWHLILVHLPILFVPLALTLLVLGLWLKKRTIHQIAIGLFVVSALASIPSFLTGEPSEERVEDIAGVSEKTIATHEEAAEFAFFLTLATGALALASFVLKNHARTEKLLLGSLVFLGALSSASLGRAGYLGGQIRHSEIRSNQNVESQAQKGEDDD